MERKWGIHYHASLLMFFMIKLEEFANETQQYLPKIWAHYVDDIFAVFDNEENNTTFYFHV